MDGREIPGFYYDQEKKKYFKVQPKHLVPTGSKYTPENVRKEKEESKKRKRSIALEQAHARQKVTPSKALRNPAVIGSGITSSLGLHTTSSTLSARASSLINGLTPHTSLDLSDDATSRIGLLPIRAEHSINCFDYDAETHGLILGISKESPNLDTLVSVLPNDTSMWPVWFGPRGQNKEGRVHYSFCNIRPMMPMQSTISSTNISKARTLVTTTTGSKYQPSVHITSLVEPSNASPSQPLDSGLSTILRPPNVTTIWTSAPNPFTSSPTATDETLAIGSSGGIFTISNAGGTWRCSTPVQTSCDALALDWLSPTTVAAGLRDGSVVLYDVRSRGSVKRLRHGGVVTGLKRADQESRLVVAGMNSHLKLYDLRMIKESVTPNKTFHGKGKETSKDGNGRKLSTGQHDSQGRPTAMPVLRFDYSNTFLYPLGLDVHPELGVIAAANDAGNIVTYSLLNGQEIRTFNVASDCTRTEDGIKVLRFVEDARSAAKLLVCRGGLILGLVW